MASDWRLTNLTNFKVATSDDGSSHKALFNARRGAREGPELLSSLRHATPPTARADTLIDHARVRLAALSLASATPSGFDGDQSQP